MTSANACRPRLVGRPRGIIPAPTVSGVQAWGLLAGLQSHEPCSTTTGSAHLSLGFIDDHAAASSSSFRPAKENTRTITRRELSLLFPTVDTRSRDYCSNFPRELHVVHKALPFRFPRKLYVTPQNTLFFPFSLLRHSNSRAPWSSVNHTREWSCVHAAHYITGFWSIRSTRASITFCRFCVT